MTAHGSGCQAGGDGRPDAQGVARQPVQGLAGGHTGAVAATQAPDAGAGSAGRSGMIYKFACPTRCKPIPLDR